MSIRAPKDLRESLALAYIVNRPLLTLDEVADILDTTGLMIWISLRHSGRPDFYGKVQPPENT